MRKKFFSLAIIVILLALSSTGKPRTPTAIIFDPLSTENESPNQIYSILDKAGYDVTYYQNSEATVSKFKTVPKNLDILIFRVHSSINHDKIWLFTGENYSQNKHTIDQLSNKVHRAKANWDDEYVFAVGSEFYQKYLEDCENTIVLVLGCDAAATEELACCFLSNGASAYVSWDGEVSLEHTDKVFQEIVKHLIQGKSIDEAVEITRKHQGNDPYCNSGLVCVKQ